MYHMFVHALQFNNAGCVSVTAPPTVSTPLFTTTAVPANCTGPESSQSEYSYLQSFQTVASDIMDSQLVDLAASAGQLCHYCNMMAWGPLVGQNSYMFIVVIMLSSFV